MQRTAMTTGIALTVGGAVLIAGDLASGPAMAEPVAAARNVAVAQPNMCTANQVELTPGRGTSSDGHWALVLRLFNKSAATCRMQGWPLVFGLDGNANLAGGAAHTLTGYFGGVTGTNPPAVDVAARATVSALIEGTSVSDGHGSCTHYQGLEVTVPDGDDLTRIDDAELSTDGSVVSCGRPQVHPVVTGTTGRQ